MKPEGQTHYKGHDIRFWIGVFFGGLLGAILMYLLGTKEGKKTSKVIEQKGKGLVDDLLKKVTEFESKGEELMQQGQEIKDQVVKKLEETKDQLTEATTQQLEETLERVEKLQEQGQKETQSIRKRIFKNLPRKK